VDGAARSKTGTGELRRDQLENHLDVARRHTYDVVVSLSNDVPPGVGDLPVEADRRKVTKVDLRGSRRYRRRSRSVGSREFVLYLAHPRSGAAAFVDMGPH
jgi:hypothetical protein